MTHLSIIYSADIVWHQGPGSFLLCAAETQQYEAQIFNVKHAYVGSCQPGQEGEKRQVHFQLCNSTDKYLNNLPCNVLYFNQRRNF